MHAVLQHINYVVGEPRLVEELPECQHSPAQLSILRAAGFVRFLSAAKAPLEMARAAAAGTLEQASCAASSVDLLLLCSDSFGDQREAGNNRLVHELADQLGAPPAFPIGINQSTCANVSSALRVARALILAGEVDTVLLVSADRCDNGRRVMDGGSAVLSDGAASCLVRRSDRGGGGYRILGFGQQAVSGAGGIAPGMADKVSGFNLAVRSLLHKTGWQPRDIDWVVPSNFNVALLELYSQVSETNFQRYFLQNLAQKAHVFASDILINLRDLQGKERIERGSKVLALSHGPQSHGVIALEAE